MYGYNIVLKLGSTPKQLLAVTQDDLSISAIIKESITKDDSGVTQREVTGHDVTFTVAGVVSNTAGTLTRLTRDEILQLSLATGSGAAIAFSYECASGAKLSGTAIITGFNESTPASIDQDATYGLNLQTTGTVTYTAATS